jgi:hypothetical protein
LEIDLKKGKKKNLSMTPFGARSVKMGPLQRPFFRVSYNFIEALVLNKCIRKLTK